MQRIITNPIEAVDYLNPNTSLTKRRKKIVKRYVRSTRAAHDTFTQRY